MKIYLLIFISYYKNFGGLMGWDGNFVIATKELLKKWLLNLHILEWVGSNLFNLNSISPKIVLHFIDRNLLRS